MPEWILARIPRSRVLRKCFGGRFLSLNERIWNRLPLALTETPLVRRYGDFLHSVVRLRSTRWQYHATFFLRNRPELQLISSLLQQKADERSPKLAVMACSNGAEVYSILWTARSARRDLKIATEAVDISEPIVEIAKRARYSLTRTELMDTPMFERLTEKEIQDIFDWDGDEVVVKPWIREGIHWRVADAGDPELVERLGPQDIVVANRFLCHMAPPEAERCLRNIANLVAPGGYLFVSGVDLDVRTKLALELGWTPVKNLLEEIHNGDPSVKTGWPWKYWGLEPFTKNRRDWQVRYASVFQVGSPTAMRNGPELVTK